MRILSTLAIFLLLLSSCQKEVDFQFDLPPANNPDPVDPGVPSNRSFLGDWKFVGMSVNQNSNVDASGVRATTATNYTTFDNSGMVTFTETRFIYNMTYSLKSKLKLEMYLGSSLLSSTEQDWEMLDNNVSGESEYIKRSSDSLTIKGFFMTASPVTGAPAPVTSEQYMETKVTWVGDTMVLRMKNKFTEDLSASGGMGILSNDLTGIVKFVKP